MVRSLRKRFAFTFGANLARSAISFLTVLLLARWLGPEAYGSMAFLVGTFIGLRQLSDMGASSAFFTFLSQANQTKKFVWCFLSWLIFQVSVCLFTIGLLLPSGWIEHIWHTDDRSIVLLAFVAVFMQYSVWPVIQRAGESQRRTIRVQAVGLIVTVSHLIAVSLLWYFGKLGLYAIFTAILVEYFLAALIAHRGFGYSSPEKNKKEAVKFNRILRKYLQYCLPLIPYSFLSFSYEFTDRWLLQSYGGSVEQAFYSVAAQFSTVALIATTSVLHIFWKEIAEANHNKNYNRVKTLYEKINRLLFVFSSVVASFFVPWSSDILSALLGPNYVGGAITLALMLLFPIHQAMGQLGTSMLYAIERTRLQLVIGGVFMLSSMGVSYWVLAPTDAYIPGLALASQGLAVKMVVMQIIQVNVISIVIARIWKWRIHWYQQFTCLGVCLAAGWVAHSLTRTLSFDQTLLPVEMAFAGLLYVVLIFLILLVAPGLLGFSRGELRVNYVNALRLIQQAK